MERWLPILFLSVFLVAGVGIVAVGFGEITQARATATWPTTGATIIDSSVRRGEEGTAPRIEYRYEVNGRSYTCTTIRMGLNYVASDPTFTSRFRSRYRVGQAVTIAYDPEDPESAVLEPGLYKCSFKMVFFGLLFVNFAVCALLLLWLSKP